MFNLSSVLKIILAIALLYIAFAAVVFLLQRQLLYFPSPERASAAHLRAAGLVPWPAAGDDYRGLISNDQASFPNGTIVVFHGNAGQAVDRAFYPAALAPLGYRVLLAEYPGYGGRAGKPSEAAFVADARATVAQAYEEFGEPLYLWGESLGAGVAAAVVADAPAPVAGLVMVTPWDSLPAVAQTHYPYFPARWLTLDKYDSVRNLAAYPGPVAVALAERDTIVPVHHGQRLYESLSRRKQLWLFEKAGHNSWPSDPEARWWREVTDFVAASDDQD